MNKILNYQYGDYLIQPHCLQTDDKEKIVVHHLIENVNNAKGSKPREPVLMIHGSYSSRHFWISPKGLGLAGYLFDHGFDVWIIEMRGHGASPKSSRFKHYLAEHWGQYDLPVAVDFVYEKTNQPVHLTAHSAGGVNLLMGLSRRHIDETKLKRIILIGVQATHGHSYLKIPLVFPVIKIGITMIGRFPAKILGFGSEDEANSYILQMMNWRRTGSWIDSQGYDCWEGIPQIKAPILMITSDGDKQDPKKGVEILFNRLCCEKEYLCLGKAHGNKKDYSHPGMVIDKDAKFEVYPQVLAWLQR